MLRGTDRGRRWGRRAPPFLGQMRSAGGTFCVVTCDSFMRLSLRISFALKPEGAQFGWLRQDPSRRLGAASTARLASFAEKRRSTRLRGVGRCPVSICQASFVSMEILPVWQQRQPKRTKHTQTMTKGMTCNGCFKPGICALLSATCSGARYFYVLSVISLRHMPHARGVKRMLWHRACGNCQLFKIH